MHPLELDILPEDCLKDTFQFRDLSMYCAHI